MQARSNQEGAMFEPKQAAATMPTHDFERAKAFYADKLGLRPVEESSQEALYRVGESEFALFPSHGKASGDHTQLAFDVDDIEAAVSSLREKGVVFEDYDFPGLKTTGGIAEMEEERAAWFKDSEGNVISLGERRA
jgi:catechol 2,3-dioxygenase-like lactoylglutathione lyase family enzyme